MPENELSWKHLAEQRPEDPLVNHTAVVSATGTPSSAASRFLGASGQQPTHADQQNLIGELKNAGGTDRQKQQNVKRSTILRSSIATPSSSYSVLGPFGQACRSGASRQARRLLVHLRLRALGLGGLSAKLLPRV